ncbi:MAG: alpha/beta fold hydrolase [Micromonosporaceae bacterium]|nr:alpha/beta fold hydrolase [Micromonosporaceae bacterium]
MSAAAADGAPAVEQVTFYSDGVRLAGDVFRPLAHPPTAGFPAVVVGHGFGGIKQFFVGDIARALSGHGFLALTFDYRGYGESDGPRHRLYPLEQVDDVIAASSYLRTRDDVDADRIAAYGTSFGGGVAIAAAALEPRLRATVCSVGIGDCGRWLRSLRRHWEWRDFAARLDRDRLTRARTGKSELVEPEEIMVRDPDSAEHEKQLRDRYPDRAFTLTIASAEAIGRFRPVEAAPLVAPRAVMYVGVEGDGLTPYEETLDLYRASGQPKRLLTLAGITHHQVYQPQHLFGVIESVAAFLREELDIA